MSILVLLMRTGEEVICEVNTGSEDKSGEVERYDSYFEGLRSQEIVWLIRPYKIYFNLNTNTMEGNTVMVNWPHHCSDDTYPVKRGDIITYGNPTTLIQQRYEELMKVLEQSQTDNQEAVRQGKPEEPRTKPMLVQRIDGNKTIN